MNDIGDKIKREQAAETYGRGGDTKEENWRLTC